MSRSADVTFCPEVFDPLRGIAEVVSMPAQQSTLRERIHDFDAYFASLHVRADRSVLERATKLRVMATPSTGRDHIDIAFARAGH